MKYEVTFRTGNIYVVEVEADNKEEAKELANELFEENPEDYLYDSYVGYVEVDEV